MLQQVRNRKNSSQGLATAGFTIIEVMIVLAVAGIIMAIVFLAIPALQKSNRNTQRKADASRVASLVADFITNNNGTLPTSIIVTGAATAAQVDAKNEKFSILDTTANIAVATCTAVTCDANAATPVLPATAPAADKLLYYKNADCGNGKNSPQYNASGRSYAIWYGFEGSTVTQCITS